MQGRGSGAVREFALYGETTGETDEYGLPVRYNWAAEYRGRAMVVYGHTPVPEPEWLNNTICIDTGCVFGGTADGAALPGAGARLGARRRSATGRPRSRSSRRRRRRRALSAQQAHDDLLDLEDVLGKRDRLDAPAARRSPSARRTRSAALEVMSRFAADPKWLIYLPPTMSPSETSRAPGLLEHPAEAFAYYRAHGVAKVVCEEKHMGSRAVVIVCRDEDAARTRFGVVGQGSGIVYTRTGRRFFDDPQLETRPPRARRPRRSRPRAVGRARDRLGLPRRRADAVVGEGAGAVRGQYAAVGAASRAGLAEAVAALAKAAERTQRESADLLARYTDRAGRALAPTSTPTAATAGRSAPSPTSSSRPFTCSPAKAASTSTATTPGTWTPSPALCQADPEVLLATPYRVVDVTDAGEPGRGHRLVGRADRARRRRHGRRSRSTSSPATRRGLVQPALKMPRPRVPPHHLRPGVRPPGEPRPAALARAVGQALAGAAGVRAGHRGAGALRPPRTAAARSRVRVRRAGAGERAGRSAAVERSHATGRALPG